VTKSSGKKVQQDVLPIELAPGLVLGGLCRYYDDGWYHGFLDAVYNDGTAKIRPIAANQSEVPNRKTVLLRDVKHV
jgi:hypothetical protein